MHAAVHLDDMTCVAAASAADAAAGQAGRHGGDKAARGEVRPPPERVGGAALGALSLISPTSQVDPLAGDQRSITSRRWVDHALLETLMIADLHSVRVSTRSTEPT